jgi:hypothetical protein
MRTHSTDTATHVCSSLCASLAMLVSKATSRATAFPFRSARSDAGYRSEPARIGHLRALIRAFPPSNYPGYQAMNDDDDDDDVSRSEKRAWILG